MAANQLMVDQQGQQPMNRRMLMSAFLGLTLLSSKFAAPAAPLPRISPEFSINNLSGKTTLLSSFKGRVVVLEFLFVKSQHCMRVARTLNTLQAELAPRGFQSIAIAFDAPNAAATGGEMLNSMIDNLGLTYPVGYASRANVDSYLGRSGSEMLSIPQVVVIDRTGTIRAATGGGANPSLEDANSLRTLVDALLKESEPRNGTDKK
jgi:peroxiredoxin